MFASYECENNLHTELKFIYLCTKGECVTVLHDVFLIFNTRTSGALLSPFLYLTLNESKSKSLVHTVAKYFFQIPNKSPHSRQMRKYSQNLYLAVLGQQRVVRTTVSTR